MLVKYSKKLMTLIVGVIFIALGGSLAIKGSLGLSAWDALALTVSNIFTIKVGTITIFLNGACIIVQMLMEGKRFKPVELFQFINVFLTGALINLFIYTIFSRFEVNHIVLKVLLTTIGYTIVAFGVTIILQSRFVRNPLEGVCVLITDKLKKVSLGRFRQMLDLLILAVIFILVYFSKTDITLGIGTIICLVIFGPLLDFFSKPVGKIIEKLKI